MNKSNVLWSGKPSTPELQRSEPRWVGPGALPLIEVGGFHPWGNTPSGWFMMETTRLRWVAFKETQQEFLHCCGKVCDECHEEESQCHSHHPQ